MTMWARLSIPAKFMVVAVLSTVIGLAIIFGGIIWEENQRIRTNAHGIAMSELLSIRDLVVQTMTTRPDDSEDIGIRMYNSWFDRRNEEYDGRLWTTWSPKVIQYQQEMEVEYSKPPQDEIDQLALERGEDVDAIVGETYRLTMPVVLGVTHGADQEVCFSCHGAMGLEKGEVIAVLSAEVDLKDEYAALQGRIILFIIIWVVAVLLAVGILYTMLSVIVTKPIKAISASMRALADGNTETNIPGLDRFDVIGEMAKSVQIFKDGLIKNKQMAAEQEAQAQAERDRARRVDGLTQAFEQQIGEVAAAVTMAAGNMRNAAKSLAQNAEQASGQAEKVAMTSEQTSSNSQSAADATEALAKSISGIEAQIDNASKRAREGVKLAERTNETVAKLSEGADNIGAVISMITDIAERTNLLALNATVEAARAGDAGKGFAVVAAEVQNLANQTKRATDSISTQVAEIRGATKEAVAAIRDVAANIHEIDDISSSVAEAIQEQNRSTGEIAGNVQMAADGTKDMTSGILILSEAAANTDQGANEVLSASEGLAHQAETLQSVVDQFITNVRQV